MIFRPDIKPPMWGPPDAVQYAVRHNAERMGVSVKLLMPFWEYGWGQYDIFGESFVTVDKNKLLWESRGLRFTHNMYQDSVYIYTQRITKPYQYNSIFVIYTPITTTQSATLGGTQQNNYFGSNGTGIYLSGQLKAQSQINNNGVELVGNFPNYNQKNYGFVNFGANGELYQDGLLVATGALNNDSGAYNYNYQLGFFTAGSGSSTIVFDFEIAFNTVLNYNQIEQLHYEPYALLMPVSRPFIFDMAGGLGTPTLISPAQFSTQSQPVTLQWSAVAGATKYQVQVAQDSLFTTPSVDQIVTGGTTLGVDGLVANTEHFWRVRAGDDS